MEMKIKRLSERAKLPVRATVGSAGMDLHALLDAPLTIEPGGRALVPTGIAVALPSAQSVGLVFARSGLAVKKGLTLSNGVGVIDSDYTGEIRVGLINLGEDSYTIQPGERIAQLVVMPVCLPEVREVSDLEDTTRGNGGFGSTGAV